MDHVRRSPGGVGRSCLLGRHLMKYRNDPVFERAIVGIGNDEVSDPVESGSPTDKRVDVSLSCLSEGEKERQKAKRERRRSKDSPLPPQFPPTLLEPFLPNISLPQTLYKILLYPSCRGNQTRDHLVLCEVAKDFSKTGGNEVGGVAEEDSRSIRGRSIPVFGVVFSRGWVRGVFFFRF